MGQRERRYIDIRQRDGRTKGRTNGWTDGQTDHYLPPAKRGPNYFLCHFNNTKLKIKWKVVINLECLNPQRPTDIKR